MAAKYARELLDHSRRHYLPLWNAYGSGFHSVVAIRTGHGDTGSPTSDITLGELPAQNITFRFLTGLIELAGALTDAGRIVEGLAVVEAGIEQSEPGWLTPKLLRLKGELLLMQVRLQARKRQRACSNRRWTRRTGKRCCLGSCVLQRASRACYVFKSIPPMRSLTSGRYTIASRRDSVPPALSRRNNYWMSWGIVGSRLLKRWLS